MGSGRKGKEGGGTHTGHPCLWTLGKKLDPASREEKRKGEVKNRQHFIHSGLFFLSAQETTRKQKGE